MPSYTVSGSAENFARIIASLEDIRERKGEPNEETDRELHIRWLRGVYTERINKNERKTIMATVSPDPDIVEIT